MMLESDNIKLRFARRFALVVALVAATVLVFVYGTAAGGASMLEGMLRDGERPHWYWTRMETSGYEVTAVSYAHNHNLEYQVVRGEDAYRVRLELDVASGTVAAVTIVDLSNAAGGQR